jgi:hypothetical protein
LRSRAVKRKKWKALKVQKAIKVRKAIKASRVTKVHKVNREAVETAMVVNILTLETVAAMDQAIEICRLQTLIHQLSSCCLPRNVTVQYAHKEPCLSVHVLRPLGKPFQFFQAINLNFALEISEDAKITTANLVLMTAFGGLEHSLSLYHLCLFQR